MRAFGIVLIILNLLAGGGFVYLATQDWKGRQTIQAAALRHVLVLQGLPLEPPPGAPEGFAPDDETPFVVEMAGGESTKTVSKKLLESYFQTNTAAAAPPAGGAEPTAKGPSVTLAASTAVTNQIAEVKRVQGVIKGELAKDMPAADKLALLRGWLLFQAETYATRTEYLALSSLTDPATGQRKTDQKLGEDAATLEKILDARFEAVLAKPQPTDSPAATDATLNAKEKVAKSAEWLAGPARDQADRRMRLAHLLVHLDTDAAWQKRVAVVVGLRRYVEAVTLQASRFEDMIAHVTLGMPGEEAAYLALQEQLRQKATQNQERAAAVAAIRAALVEQKTAQDDAVNRRRTQLKELTDQLNRVKAEVDELLVRQSGIERQLFEIQREVALTLEDVYRLEALLTRVERERYGMPPEQP